MELSIIIPAYNEAERIPGMLESYARTFPEAEILVVPNGCTDDTATVVRKLAIAHPNIIVQEIRETVGKAVAVRTGWEHAHGEWLAFVDADGSTSAAEFQRILQARDSADGVIASRWKRGANVENRTALRELASYLFAVIVKLLFWLPYRDTQCGAKVFRRSFITPYLAHARVTNMAFDVELLLLMRAQRARIIEFPTHWVDSSDSAVLGSPWKLVRNSLTMLKTLFILRFQSSPLTANHV